MLDPWFMILVFAPATVGLVATALRRMPPIVYWSSLMGIITIALMGLRYQQLGADSIEIDPLVFGLVFVVVPTIAAFSVGRLIALNRGGAYAFAASCTAYLFGLGIALGIGIISRVMVP